MMPEFPTAKCRLIPLLRNYHVAKCESQSALGAIFRTDWLSMIFKVGRGNRERREPPIRLMTWIKLATVDASNYAIQAGQIIAYCQTLPFLRRTT